MTHDDAHQLLLGDKITHTPSEKKCVFGGWSETSPNLCMVEDADDAIDMLHADDFVKEYTIDWS